MIKGHTLIKPLKLHIKLQTSMRVQTQEAFKIYIYIYIYINTFHLSQLRTEAFFNRGNIQKQGCLRCSVILGHFQHRTLQCSLVKTITTPHLIFVVTYVQCGVVQNLTKTIAKPHFIFMITCAVQCIRCGLKPVYFSNFGFFLPIIKLIFSFVLGQVLNY